MRGVRRGRREDDRLAGHEVEDGDDAVLGEDVRPVAAIGRLPHRPAHRRRRVAALCRELARAVPPEAANDLRVRLRGERRRSLPLRLALRLRLRLRLRLDAGGAPHLRVLADAEVAALKDQLGGAVRRLHDLEDRPGERCRLQLPGRPDADQRDRAVPSVDDRAERDLL